MKRKLLATLLTLAMVFSLLPMTALAEETTVYSDVEGHWAEDAILRWSSYAVLQGYDGKFLPEGTLTRGQMAVILSRLLALPAAPSAGFTDVAPDAWYADGINRCAAVGILLGSGGKAMPEDPITREQAMVMLCRALGIEPVEGVELGNYPDLGDISSFAYGYVAALVQRGVVRGDQSNKLNPGQKISRAEIVTMIDRLVVHYGCRDGEVIDAADGGLTVVVAKNVEVVNAPAGTRVVVADGADGLKVNGAAIADDQTYIVPDKEQPGKPGNNVMPVAPGHQHSYTWKSDATGHWQVCAVCGAEGSRDSHAYGAGVTAKEPTCAEAGQVQFTCGVCGYVKTETLPALAHTWGDPKIAYAQNGEDGEKVYTCSVCSTTKSEPIAWKLGLAVESGSKVDLTVGEDYTAVATLPAKGATVNTASVSATVKLKNVDSLGVDGEKSKTITVNTGIGGADGLNVVLSDALKNCYSFSGAKVSVNVDGNACTYDFAAINDDNQIVATTDTEAARAAWKALTANITTSRQEQSDSYAVIANTSYLMIGEEKLVFEEGAENLKLDNLNDLGALNKAARDAVKLEACEDQKGTITLFVGAGTQLVVGSSVATLDKDCTITIEVSEDQLYGKLYNGQQGPLAQIKAATNTTTMVKTLIDLFDKIVGVVDASNTVDVNIAFVSNR